MQLGLSVLGVSKIELIGATMQPAAAPVLRLLRVTVAARCAPLLLCLLAPRVYARNRDGLEFTAKLANLLVYMPVHVAALMPSDQFEVLADMTSHALHHPTALLTMDYFVWPVLQCLTLLFHVTGCVLYIVRDVAMRSRLASEGLLQSTLFLVSERAWPPLLAALCTAALLVVACAELRLRALFVAAAARS